MTPEADGPVRRRVTHLAATPSGTHGFFVFAVCDDGTFWGYDKGEREWESLPSIPDPTATRKGAL